MPLTLHELVADAELRLTPHTVAPERPVSWVHTSELADPTPFLAGGELLLTTGLALRPEHCTEFVARLTEVDVAGLGFGVGLSHNEVPPALVTAARQYGLPLVEVARETPFIAISKAVSRSLAADEYAAVRRTSRAQHELARAAGRPGGLAALVRKLAKLLDAWVLLLDRSGTATHAAPVSAAEKLPALATEIARLRGKKGLAAAGISLSGAEVSMQALGGKARGFLVVGRTEPFAAADHHVINSAASLLTLALEQVDAFAVARRHLRAGFLRLMVRGELAQDALGDLHAELPPEPFEVVVLRNGQDTGGLLDLLEADKPGRTPYLAEHEGVIVALSSRRDVGWLAAWVEQHADVRAGVSRPCDLTTVDDGLRQARQAAEAAPRGAGPVARFEDLAGHGLLQLVPEADARAFAESLLEPLLDDDTLLTSLREWLAQHGQWDPAASRLGVHRHTLRNRVRKIQERLGRGLDQPGVRAEMWLALQVLDRPDG